MEQLGEIDKGLRSSNFGDQCEAIASFEKFARDNFKNAVLINAAFLKLADFFRTSQNFARFWVLKVFLEIGEQSLLKAINLDEILRRINSVMQSNDPIARALSLRVFGGMPRVIVDKLHIHHGIRNSLESHHQLESEAAVYAIDNLCSYSGVFCEGVIDKLSTLIQATDTRLEKKLKIIRIFRHMYHSPKIAFLAREICTSIFEQYPSRDFVITIIDTLTHLSQRSLLDIPLHIEFIEKVMNSEQRKSVKIECLKSLIKLSLVAPHHSFNFQNLLLLFEQSVHADIKYYILKLAKILSPFLSDDLQLKILHNCENCLNQENSKNVQHAADVLATILCSSSLKCPDEIRSRIVTSLCVMTVSSLISSEQSDGANIILKSLFRIAREDEKYVCKVVELLLPLVPQIQEEDRCLIICRFISKFLHFYGKPEKYAGDLISLLSNESILQRSRIVSSLSFSLFNSRISEDLLLQISKKIESYLRENRISAWSSFLFARNAFCFGYHELSANIMGCLASMVDSESNYFWLQALQSISKAHSFLKHKNISHSISLLSDSVTLMAASKASSTVSFVIQFLSIRISFLEFIHSLRVVPEPVEESKISSLFTSIANISTSLKELQKYVMDASSTALMQQSIVQLDILSHILNILYRNDSSALLLLRNINLEDGVKHPITFANKKLLELFQEQYLQKQLNNTLEITADLLEQSQKFCPLYFFVNKSKKL